MRDTEDNGSTDGQDPPAASRRGARGGDAIGVPGGRAVEPVETVEGIEPADSAGASGPAETADASAPADTPGSRPTLTVAEVARRLGVAPATLRTWDRRYRLGPSEHTAGAHRRYSAADLARLMTMRSLTLDGVPPSEAARIARDTEPVPEPRAAAARHLTAVPDLIRSDLGVRGSVPRAAHPPAGPDLPADAARSGARAAHPTAHPTTAHPVAAGRPAARAAGWDVPATPTAVIDAALHADADAVERLLDLPAGGDVARWWADLVEPTRSGIAARTVLARPGDEPDALVVAAALAVLRERSGHVPRHPSRRRIVLMLAAPGESRPLSLHVLAGALADVGVDARVVAGPAGRHRLLEIVTMTAPSAVVLASERSTPDLGMVAALAEQHPALPVYVMVPDDAAHTVPMGRQVHRVRTVPGLVHEVLAVCS